MFARRIQKQTIIGIDISDGSLELAYIPIGDDSIHAVTLSHVVLPDHVIVHGLIHDETHLIQAMRQLYAEAGLETHTLPIAIALPDPQVTVTSVPVTQR